MGGAACGAAIRRRSPARVRNWRSEILFYQYLQWLADDQWQDARDAAAPVALFGDFPFMVAADSADVWARQHLFRFDATVGVPPDAFSATGQDWGVPVYRWDVMDREDYRWLRQRAKRSARLFDGYRIDHLVGFYRTFSRPLDSPEGSLRPAERGRSARPRRTPHGDFHRVRGTDHRRGSRRRARLRARVAHQPGHPRVQSLPLGARVGGARPAVPRPGAIPRALCGHDRHARHRPDRDVVGHGRRRTSAQRLRAAADRARVGRPSPTAAPFTPALRDAILRTLYASASDLLLIPFQDVFGWTDRINTPATVTDENWTWRLPWPVDTLADQSAASERAALLRAWARETGRTGHAAMHRMHNERMHLRYSSILESASCTAAFAFPVY